MLFEDQDETVAIIFDVEPDDSMHRAQFFGLTIVGYGGSDNTWTELEVSPTLSAKATEVLDRCQRHVRTRYPVQVIDVEPDDWGGKRRLCVHVGDWLAVEAAAAGSPHLMLERYAPGIGAAVFSGGALQFRIAP